MLFSIDPAKHMSGSDLTSLGYYGGKERWTSKCPAAIDRNQAKPGQKKMPRSQRYYKTLMVSEGNEI